MFGLGTQSICYYILGAGLLIPWNAFITASDYYSEEFTGKHVDRLITIAYLPVNLVILGLQLSCASQRRLPRSNVRIVSAFCVYSFTMLLVPVMDLLGILSLSSLLLLVSFSGASDGIAQGSLFGEAAASADPLNTQALIFGTSTSGMFVSLLRLCTKASFPATQATHISSNLYFVIAGFICILCIWILSFALRENGSTDVDSDQERLQGCSCEGTNLFGTGESLSIDVQYPSRLEHYTSIGDIVRKIWHTLLSNTICYWVTLSIFPGVLAEDLDSLGNSWYPLMLIFIFNASDCLGKLCPRSIQTKFCSKTSVLLAALARCCFIPLFLISSFRSVPALSILTILLGVSNGALTTINMIYATMLVDSREQQLCGAVSVFFLVLGLNLGAFSGFFWLL